MPWVFYSDLNFFLLLWVFRFILLRVLYFVLAIVGHRTFFWLPFASFFFTFIQDLFYFPSSFSNSFYFTSAVLLLSFIDSLFSFSIFFFYFPSAFLFFIFYPPFQISSFAHRFAFTSLKRLYTYLRKPRASRMLLLRQGGNPEV